MHKFFESEYPEDFTAGDIKEWQGNSNSLPWIFSDNTAWLVVLLLGALVLVCGLFTGLIHG